jgi:hypothetical protein
MLNNRILMILATAVSSVVRECDPANRTVGRPDAAGQRGRSGGSPGNRGFPHICSAVGDRPGCDANFSLVAVQSGRWCAVRGMGNRYLTQSTACGGVHVAINCLNVIGNRAYVSGVVTQSSI